MGQSHESYVCELSPPHLFSFCRTVHTTVLLALLSKHRKHSHFYCLDSLVKFVSTGLFFFLIQFSFRSADM